MPMLEQFAQIALAGNGGVWAGDLICKEAKRQLAEMGLVEPMYGSTFRLTPCGCKEWERLVAMLNGSSPVASQTHSTIPEAGWCSGFPGIGDGSNG